MVEISSRQSILFIDKLKLRIKSSAANFSDINSFCNKWIIEYSKIDRICLNVSDKKFRPHSPEEKFRTEFRTNGLILCG